jgi:hypothetical protein
MEVKVKRKKNKRRSCKKEEPGNKKGVRTKKNEGCEYKKGEGKKEERGMSLEEGKKGRSSKKREEKMKQINWKRNE